MKDILQNPTGTQEPYYFAEEGGTIEGAVHSIATILERFEPMDVLNGKTIIYDSNGKIITIRTEDGSIIERNEYPQGYAGITYEVSEAEPDSSDKVTKLVQEGGSLTFLD